MAENNGELDQFVWQAMRRYLKGQSVYDEIVVERVVDDTFR
jgi:hypothetical protein